MAVGGKEAGPSNDVRAAAVNGAVGTDRVRGSSNGVAGNGTRTASVDSLKYATAAHAAMGAAPRPDAPALGSATYKPGSYVATSTTTAATAWHTLAANDMFNVSSVSVG